MKTKTPYQVPRKAKSSKVKLWNLKKVSAINKEMTKDGRYKIKYSGLSFKLIGLRKLIFYQS